MDNLSSDNDRWSAPVLDDKPSTQSEDLKLDDITPSGTPYDFEDDQLVSESCYVPITESHSVLSQDTENVSSSQDDFDQPLMTEEEAFKLIHLAATVIQARVKGFLTRRKFDFYKHRHRKRAATLIQAVWRGYRTRTYNVKVIRVKNEIQTRRLMAHVNYLAGLAIRCQDQATRDKRTMAKAIKCLWSELEKQNTRYVTWLTTQQNQAAVKIQQHWRGYKVRKLYPRPSPLKPTSYLGFVQMCRNMQEQIDLLRKEVELLKSDKPTMKINENCDQKEPAEPRSIPAIRIIRPSVCVLPELKLESSTKEHLKKQANFESVLDDVDIEPLDIGDYDQNNQDYDQESQDIGNTTFDVEKSNFDVDNFYECGNKSGSSEDQDKDQVTESPSEIQANSKEPQCAIADLIPREQEIKDIILESIYQSDDFACSGTKDIATTDTVKMRDVIPNGKQETVMSDSTISMGNSEHKSIAQHAEGVTSESDLSKHDQDSDVSCATSIQGDISLSSDASQASDSSASPTKSERKKKKLLLRSTSTDQVTRLRSLHASSSLDSERLSSSLNFDSRLSQRAASLLQNLRSEIARVTARHISKEENFDENVTAETKGMDSFDSLKQHSTFEANENKTKSKTYSRQSQSGPLSFKADILRQDTERSAKSKTDTHQGQSELFSNTADISQQDANRHAKPKSDIHQSQSEALSSTADMSRQDTETPDHTTETDDWSLEKTNLVLDKVDVVRKGGEIFDKISVSKIDNQEETPPREASQVSLSREEVEAFSEGPENQQENVELFLDRGARGVPANHGAPENGSDDRTDKDTHSFSMPVFHDVEASLSLEDFMDDSLEQQDT